MFLSLSTLLSRGRKVDHLVAIRDEELLTFGMFQNDVQALIRKLPRDDHSAFVLTAKDSYMFVVGFFALMHAGRSIVLPPNSQPETLSVLKSQGYSLLKDCKVETPAKTEVEDDCANAIPLNALKPETCAIDFYTSGSIGKPKKVCKTIQQLEVELSVLEALWGDMLSDSITLSTVTHQHIYGLLFKLLWPICAGRPFVVQTYSYWEQLAARLHQKCCIISSPAHLARYHDGFDVNHKDAPEIIFSSGGPLHYKAAQETTIRFKRVPTEVYGSTETGGLAYRQQHSENDLWTPFNVVDLDENNGVLQVRSPYLETDEWYTTNDLVQFEENGQFKLLGRNDRIVKIEGKRISLPELEDALVNHKWVKDISTLVLPDTRKSLACVVVLTHLGEELRKQHGNFRFKQKLRAALLDRFELMVLPKRWRFVKQIPQTPQGKRLHRDLTALFS